MGALHFLSNFCTVTNTRTNRKPMQTVEIKVKMDCDGCERKVKNAVNSIKGLKTVEVNRKQNRITVSGHIDPNKVLKRVKSTGKMAIFWPYASYDLVSYPYVAQAYDKKAPAGFVKNVPQANAEEHTITYLFSDDNPNACSIM
uniref:Heavy metal-associated isoprenylated plant protein 21-like n=1 Tax=Nicotiana tabacum TaxID=4097 RepID=A0A1S4AST6_TOBAC|nr:PREDICTED: heavy metal-associated isoprenylated plant protein 21-like [Nicotiana tabacum]